MRTLTRPELTAALAARQMLLERRHLRPAEAIRRLTPLQGQDSPAPYVALAARLDGFEPPQLERALRSRRVVKTTIMRMTLHLVAATDYPAYAQLARQASMRNWRKSHPELDEAEVTAELPILAGRAADQRSRFATACSRLRRRGRQRVGVGDVRPHAPAARPATAGRVLARAGPAGLRRRPAPAARARRGGHARARPLPGGLRAGEHGATPPPGRALHSATSPTRGSGSATVSYRGEDGAELLDLPRRPLPPESTPLPVRLLSRWEQPLLAYADRERIIPASIQPLKLTLSGDQTVTVDGRVAASWQLRRGSDARAGGDHAAHRDPPLAARRDPRRGKAHRPLLRARGAKHRGGRGLWVGLSL